MQPIDDLVLLNNSIDRIDKMTTIAYRRYLVQTGRVLKCLTNCWAQCFQVFGLQIQARTDQALVPAR